MASHYQKHFPLPRSCFRAIMCPSFDPRLRLNRPQFEICLVQRRRCHSPSLGAVAQSLNVLLLYVNMNNW
jgi:hypothetical protein